ncbi:hypothetical protein V6N13_135823 [Hibiscus sabdariffa]
MRQDVIDYTKTCLICQQDKVHQKKSAGLLEPLPVPTRPWESVSLDFNISLPRVGDLGTIIVVVDRFSKYATFISAPKYCFAEETARLVFKHIDGQTEHFNGLLDEYLRHFIQANQTNWHQLLDMAQLSFNSQKSSATNKSPFDIVTEKIAKHMKKWSDRGRRDQQFKVGDLVLIKLIAKQLRFLRNRDRRLVRKYEVPLSIVAKIGNNSYKIKLPTWMKVHHVLRGSNLKLFHVDPMDASRGQLVR